MTKTTTKTTKARKTSKTAKAGGECPNCGYTLQVLKFAGRGKVTCPDCGWRQSNPEGWGKGKDAEKPDTTTAAGQEAFLLQKMAEKKAPNLYAGSPIPATKVFVRKMTEFKNCDAECWLLVNDKEGTYTFANTYNSQLKASYNPIHYTYQLNEAAQKKIDKKTKNMTEVEADQWPQWITAPRTRKSK